MTAVAHSSPGRDLRLTGWQVRYQQLSFWRNRRAAFFALIFPAMFLAIFGGLNSGATLDVRNHLSFIDFYTPGIMAYAVLLICFNNTALIFATLRTDGTLKRVRTTPLPWIVYVVGAIASTTIVLLISIVLLFALGVPVFGAHVPGEKMIGLLVTLALGTADLTLQEVAYGIATFPAGGEEVTPVFITTARPRPCRTSPRSCRCARWPTACRRRSTRAFMGPASSSTTC